MQKQAVGRSRVLGDRGAQLFRSIVPKSDMQSKTEEGKQVLQAPVGYRRAPEKTACASCGKMTPSAYPKCAWCGDGNQNHCSVAEAVSRGAKHSGYTREQPPIADVKGALLTVQGATKAHLARWSGDLMKQMRKRKLCEEDAQPGDAAQSAPKQAKAEACAAEAEPEEADLLE